MEFPSMFIEELMKVSLTMRKTDNNNENKGKRLFWQPWLDDSEDSSKQSNKQLPTTKWKRDRRSRLPEYTRKSDPKITETFGDSLTNSITTTAAILETTITTTTTTTTVTTTNNNQESSNGPLDMSVRQRGLPPPSYNQTINNPSYRCGNIRYRPSVIQNNREELPPGISMCDPIIDEHFRRSLGNDYLTLFANNNVAKETIPIKQTPLPPSTKIPATNVIELMDTAGLSVDDHFAKALGDTWLKLNKKEQEIKNNNNNNNNENLVST